MSAPSEKRRLEILVAPVITFLAVIALLGVARIYDHSPVKAPECRFKSLLGIPCVSCGGTRSMQALAHGDIAKAAALNPAVILGTLASISWLALGFIRWHKGESPPTVDQQNRRIKTVCLVIGCVLVLNWLYLVVYLK